MGFDIELLQAILAELKETNALLRQIADKEQQPVLREKAVITPKPRQTRQRRKAQ